MNLPLTNITKKSLLSILMLFTIGGLRAESAPAESFKEAIIAPQDQAELYSKLHELFVDLLDKIDAIFDTIGQAYSHGAIGKQLKAAEKAHIDTILLHLRKNVSILKQNASFFQNPNHSTAIAYEITELVNALQFISSKGLTELLNNPKPLKHHRSVTITQANFHTITPRQLTMLVDELNHELVTVAKASESLGLSRTNKAYRAVRKAWKQYYMSAIAERIAVYGALGMWVVYMSSGTGLNAFADRLPACIGEPLKNLKKNVLGGKPKPSGDTGHSTELPIVDKDNTLVFHKAVVDPKDLDFSGAKKVACSKEEYDDLIKKGAQKITFGSATKNGGGSGGETILHKFLEAAGGLLTIDNSNPIIHVPVALGFATYLKKDFYIIREKVNRALGVIDDKLYGLVKQRTFTEIIVGTDLTFKDIIGRSFIKSELSKIIDYVVNPTKYDRNNITVEKGILFVGPSQNGKSVMVKAFANELTNALAKAGQANQVRLVTIPVKEIIQRGGISEFVAMAESVGTPVILAIDEFDMLCLQRDRDSKMLADVLTAMSSGLSASEKNMVIIIGLTNKPTNIDFALRQHGRFGKVLWFDKPTYKDRYEFFEKELKRCFLDLTNFNCSKLAHETEGASFGALLAVAKRAFFNAKQASIAVTQHHFEDAIDTEIKNIVYTGEALSAEKERSIAIQQAGKALISMIIKPRKELCKVTIMPYTQELEEEHVHQSYNWSQSQADKKPEQRVIKYGGIFSYSPSDEPLGQSLEQAAKEAKILLAGQIAQVVMQEPGIYTCKEDKELAFALVRTVVTEGEDTILKNLPKVAREQLLTRTYARMKEYEKEVKQLLITHQDLLKELVEHLEKYKELGKEQIAEFEAKLVQKKHTSSPITSIASAYIG